MRPTFSLRMFLQGTATFIACHCGKINMGNSPLRSMHIPTTTHKSSTRKNKQAKNIILENFCVGRCWRHRKHRSFWAPLCGWRPSARSPRGGLEQHQKPKHTPNIPVSAHTAAWLYCYRKFQRTCGGGGGGGYPHGAVARALSPQPAPTTTLK